jgi:hypothetical protein
MRIKLFESFTDDYYKEITYDEWGHSFIMMTESTIKKIRYFLLTNYGISAILTHKKDPSRDWVQNFLSYESGDLTGIIYESEDEYFYITIFDYKDIKYYKCDQFEGLFKFLKDKEII